MKAPAFQFYAQDFLTGTMYLTNEEIGMYIKMLAKQWTDGKIPKKRLGFLVGCDWDNLSEELQSKFTDCGEYILNERLEIEREKKANFRKKQAENGKKGGRPKKNKKHKYSRNEDIKEEENPNKPKPFKNNNPNESQKKPLEKEDEVEIEDRSKKKEKRITKEKPKIIYPYDSPEFKAQWDLWKQYKKKQHRFTYKSEISEQAALRKIGKLATNEKTAIAIIHQSIENGWAGIFELKENGNNKTGNNSTSNAFERANSFIDALHHPD